MRTWLLVVLFCAFSAHADYEFCSPQTPVGPLQITEIWPALNEVFNKLKPGDVVVFDLDNTIFREKQMLGTDEWWQLAIGDLMAAEGLTAREASMALSDVNLRIKSATKMRLMEAALPRLIRELQDRCVWVMGLTARHPKLAPSTLKALRDLKIDFDYMPGHRNFDGFKIADGNEFLWQGGVAFTDGARKGPVFHAMFESRELPIARNVVAIDDRVEHVNSLIEAMQDLGISGTVVHYLKSREEPFDNDIARYQHRYFLKTGRIISDAQAFRRINCARDLAGK